MNDQELAQSILDAQQDLARIENNILCGHGLTMEEACDLAAFVQTQLEDIRRAIEARSPDNKAILA